MDWITINEAIGFLFDVPSAFSLKNSSIKLYCDSFYFNRYWEEVYYFHSPIYFYAQYITFFENENEGWNQVYRYSMASKIIEKTGNGGIMEVNGGIKISIYR